MKAGSGLGLRKSGGYAIRAALVFAATVESVTAQGTLSLNTAIGPQPRVTLDGRNVHPEDNIFVRVLVAGASSLTGIDTFALTLTGANAGLFSKGTLTVNGKPDGSVVDVTIRAWDKDTGDTYDQATVRASTTLSDFVLREVNPINGTDLPNVIVPAFKGLALVTPEPGTYAPAALGFVGLFFVRRRHHIAVSRCK